MYSRTAHCSTHCPQYPFSRRPSTPCTFQPLPELFHRESSCNLLSIPKTWAAVAPGLADDRRHDRSQSHKSRPHPASCPGFDGLEGHKLGRRTLDLPFRFHSQPRGLPYPAGFRSLRILRTYAAPCFATTPTTTLGRNGSTLDSPTLDPNDGEEEDDDRDAASCGFLLLLWTAPNGAPPRPGTALHGVRHRARPPPAWPRNRSSQRPKRTGPPPYAPHGT